MSFNVKVAPVPLAAYRFVPDSHVTFPDPSITTYLYWTVGPVQEPLAKSPCTRSQ